MIQNQIRHKVPFTPWPSMILGDEYGNDPTDKEVDDYIESMEKHLDWCFQERMWEGREVPKWKCDECNRTLSLGYNGRV